MDSEQLKIIRTRLRCMWKGIMETPEEVSIWYQAFKNRDMETVEDAVIRYIQEKPWKPTPADIIEMIPAAQAKKMHYAPKFDTLPDGSTRQVVQCKRCMDRGLITWEDNDGCVWGRPCTCAAALDKYSEAERRAQK